MRTCRLIRSRQAVSTGSSLFCRVLRNAVEKRAETPLDFRRAGSDVPYEFEGFTLGAELLKPVGIVVYAHEKPGNRNFENLGNLP